MPAPVHRLKKSEIVWLGNHHCTTHNHSYLEHYNCYLAEVEGAVQKIGFFDIEASNLDADFGFVLSWCIKPHGSPKILSSLLTKEDLDNAKIGAEDGRLMRELVEVLTGFDKIITYYGARFDIPFVRARAVICGIKFPVFGSLIHNDLYFVVRNRFKLSSRRLENACRVLLGQTNKTKIEPAYWRAASRGDEESLAYILDHNRKDVEDLERLYNFTIDYAARRDTSI